RGGASRATPVGVGGVRPKLDRQHLSERLKHYAGRAGLSADHTFHSLRPAHASWRAQGGVGTYRVQGQDDLGRAPFGAAAKFAALRASQVRTAMSAETTGCRCLPVWVAGLPADTVVSADVRDPVREPLCLSIQTTISSCSSGAWRSGRGR